ncbi:MAG: asparagine synthase (glutamine-hydrolyzing) [Akkermansiaceae bacterium]|nr:asparagine synthase (glutamine-hydrolyzing) [Akkermansiaceae bacterium]MCP5551805.1 asparagine synthase (glutamine-hydrolyzing) [Akkermansiaceae bacterium]
MCGIGGIVRAGDRSLSSPEIESRLGAMGRAMRHRGPDEEGMHLDDRLGLMHCRLSIVGLENGRQPLTNEDESVVVVCNGEFFDHEEKRAWLEGRGHVFRTRSDCEILAHLYEDFGIEGLFGHLRGQFAFALWDRRKGTLFLARDRMGIVPLFWTRRREGGGVAFASEIKGLLAAGEAVAAADRLGLNHLFSMFALPTRRTCFEGVSAVLPGTWLEIDAGSGAVSEHRYWDLSFPDRGDEWRPDRAGDAVAGFREAFEEAVRLRSRADVPVVSYLSGGVDSTAVLATASRLQGKPMRAFTIRIPSEGLDEIEPATAAANTVGAVPESIVCGDREIGETFPELVTAAEAPVIDTSCAALLRLSGLVRDSGYKVALTGEGADELLAGYPWFKTGRLIGVLDRPGFRPSNLIRFLGFKLFQPGGSFRKSVRAQRYIGGPQGITDLYGMLMTSRRHFYSDAMWQAVGDRFAYEDLDLNLDAMARWHPLNAMLYFGCKTLLPGMLLQQKGDRVAMRHSVETRYPFLDEKVVDFCSAIHPRWKMRGFFRDKFLLREYADGFLPASITRRTKQIFRAPFASTFFNDPPAYAGQLLSRESLERTGYFDVEGVLGQWERFRNYSWAGGRRLIVEMGLTAVMTTQLWHHLYLGGGLCDLPRWSVEPD